MATIVLQTVQLMLESRKTYVYGIVGDVNYGKSYTNRKYNEIEKFKKEIFSKLVPYYRYFDSDVSLSVEESSDKTHRENVEAEIDSALFPNR